MYALLALSVLAAQEAASTEDEKYAKAYALVKLPAEAACKKHAEKGPYEKRAIELLQSRATWIEAFRRVDERCGLLREGVPIEVRFADALPSPAQGGAVAAGGKVTGRIDFSVAAMAQAIKTCEELDRLKMPRHTATRPEMNVYHELTHVFQSAARMGLRPAWLAEGQATFVEQDEAKVRAYRRQVAGKLPDLDASISETDGYGRGWLFFRYLETTVGMEKVREFSSLWLAKGGDFKKAAAKVTGKTWEALKADELDCATRLLAEMK